jgi:C-terminal processing protease CtpA/Prc
LSVENKDCSSEQIGITTVDRMLQHAVGDVTVVVHNQGGRSDLVQSMITKSRPDERSGLSLCSDAAHASIAIAGIRDGSKLANSLLSVGDVILEINQTPCGHLKLQGAAKLIAENPFRITILARRCRDTGVVLAQLPDHNVLDGSKLKQEIKKEPCRVFELLRCLQKALVPAL